jgi:hypothetical protein
VAETTTRTLFVLMKSTSWNVDLFHQAVPLIVQITQSIEWAYSHLLDETKMDEETVNNEHDLDFAEVVALTMQYGVSTIWGLAHKLLAFVSNDKSKVHLLTQLPTDKLFVTFQNMAMHKFNNELDTFVQAGASGVASLMTAFRSVLRLVDEESAASPCQSSTVMNTMKYSRVVALLFEMVQKPLNLNVFINGLCGISQLLTRTFQTPDGPDAVAATLDLGMWEFLLSLLHNEQSLLHVNSTSQIAAVNILMHLSQHVQTELSSDHVEALEMILYEDWQHVHVYAAALIWGISQHPRERSAVAKSKQIFEGLLIIMKSEALEPREWAAAAIFNLMQELPFLLYCVSAGLSDLVAVLVEAQLLIKTGAAVVPNCSAAGITDGCEQDRAPAFREYEEKMVWNSLNSEACTSSTLLYSVIGSLWIVSANDEVASALFELPVANATTGLALACASKIQGGDYSIQCPKLRRFCIGLAQSLWRHANHKVIMKFNFREDVMEHLFVGLLDSPDVSSKCEAAVGISICAMEWHSKVAIGKLGGISKIASVLRTSLENEFAGTDLIYCCLQALLNLSQERKNQLIICKVALAVLAEIADVTTDPEIFSLSRAIMANLEKNSTNKQQVLCSKLHFFG